MSRHAGASPAARCSPPWPASPRSRPPTRCVGERFARVRFGPGLATGGAPGFMDWSGSTAAGSTSYWTSIRSRAFFGDGQLVGGHGGHRLPDDRPRGSMASNGVSARWRLALQLGDIGGGEDGRTPGNACARWCRSSRCARARAGCAGAGVQEAARLEIGEYWTWPVTFSGPSGRGMESPTPLTSRVVFIVVAWTHASRAGAAPATSVIGGDHLRVAGAATEVAAIP